MRYLYLVYHQVADEVGLLHTQLDKLRACQDELRAAGCAIASSLQPPDAAVTVCVRGSRVTVTEGPPADGRLRLSWFSLIDARDLNDAIRLAARVPQARTGWVEVRPLADLPDHPARS